MSVTQAPPQGVYPNRRARNSVERSRTRRCRDSPAVTLSSRRTEDVEAAEDEVGAVTPGFRRSIPYFGA